MSAFRERLYREYLTTSAERTIASRTELDARAGILRRHVLPHFPDNRRVPVLDIGCGCGALLRAAESEGFETVHGVDRSPQQVEHAAELGVRGVREADAIQHLHACATDSLGVVTTLDVIEHLTRDELLELADGIHRALAPRGRWILTCPNGQSPMVGRVRYGDLTHEQAFTPRSLHQLLRLVGFESVQCHEIGPVVHGLASAVRAVLWQLLRLPIVFYVAVETGVLERGVFTQNLLAVAVKAEGAPADSDPSAALDT